MRQFPMRLFAEINPLTIKQHPNLVASLPDITPNRTWYFLIIDDYMVIATAYYKEQTQKWLHYQIEFPKLGLIWYLDTIRNKFFKTEAEGGLPKGKIEAGGVVDGERLAIARAFNADGNRGVFLRYRRPQRWLTKKLYLYRCLVV